MPGTIEAKTLRTEQYEFEARTTDPANAESGEYWIRTDQTGSDPQVVAELRRQDTSGVSKIPLFASSEESNLGSNVSRGPSVVLDDGSIGFVAMTNDSGAKFGSPRAVTTAGAEYLSHNSLTLSAIPDSGLLHEWDVRNVSLNGGDTVSNGDYVDSEGSADLDVANGSPVYRADHNGQPAIELDVGSFVTSTVSVSRPFVVFQVIDPISDPPRQGLWRHSSQQSYIENRFSEDNITVDFYDLSGPSDEFVPYGNAFTDLSVFTTIMDSNDAAIRRDNSKIANISAGDSTNTLNEFNLGLGFDSSRAFSGYMHYCSIWDYSQISGQISDVENSLNDIFGAY